MKDLVEIINTRTSTRRFLSKHVDKALIDKILNIARYAPSGGNMQPWHIAIVSGSTKEKLCQAVKQEIQNEQAPNPDYDYYPLTFFEPFATRRHLAGSMLYHADGIAFDDKYQDWQNVRRLFMQNYEFFGAQIGMIFYMDDRLTPGAHTDLGIFLQTIMLLAEYYNLGTCPQASWSNYPDIVRSVLGIGEGMRIICGMSLGYRDPHAPLNQCRTERESLENFATWYI